MLSMKLLLHKYLTRNRASQLLPLKHIDSRVVLHLVASRFMSCVMENLNKVKLTTVGVLTLVRNIIEMYYWHRDF